MPRARGSRRRCAVRKHQTEHKALNLEWEKLLGSSAGDECPGERAQLYRRGWGHHVEKAKVDLDLSFPTKINSKCVKSLRVCKRLKLLGQS